MIVSLILPRDIPTEYHTKGKVLYSGRRDTQVTERFEICNKASHSPRRAGNQHRYSILYIRRFHAEALRLMHARTFSIKLTEHAFETNTSLAPMEYAAAKRVQWHWTSVFSNITFSEAHGLILEISPVDIEGFWPNATSALRSLCSSRNLTDGRIKKLLVIVNDMRCTCKDVPRIRPMVPRVRSIQPTLEQYGEALKPLKWVVSSALQCDLYLPYWLMKYKARHELVWEWERRGARVVFEPSVCQGRSDEEESRKRVSLGLAPLPYQYYYCANP